MPPLVVVTGAWVAGLIVARSWLELAGTASASLILLGLLPLAALLLWHRDRSMRLSSVSFLTLLLAVVRYQSSLPNWTNPRFVGYYNDRGTTTIEGVIGDYPDVRDTVTYLTLDAAFMEREGERHPVYGKVLVRAPRYPEYQYGDRIRVHGRLETPPEPGQFSYRAYLERKGIYSWVERPRIERLASGQGNQLRQLMFTIRDRACGLLARLMPEPEASLLQGILLGARSGIPTDLAQDFNTTGTSHLLVISGTNIALVTALCSRTFGRIVGKRRAYWFTMAGIALYVLLVGADAAVLRAGLMGGLWATALYLGRQATAYVSLCASALVLTVSHPLSFWDLGFQLSFAATLGLIVFAPPFEQAMARGLQQVRLPEPARHVLGFLNEGLVLTVAAQVLTLPLVVYHFGRLSLVAPLANLLVLPVQAPTMVLGGAAAMLGQLPLLEPIARILAWIPWLCLAYTGAVVRWLADWPFAAFAVDEAQATRAIVVYGLIVGIGWFAGPGRAFFRGIRGKVPFPRLSAMTLAGLLAVAILAWIAVLQLPDRKLHVAFLDVGQGDAVLITTPQGQQVLVDGGPSPAALTTALGRYMPFWDRSLDLVVMTHPDEDHITGLVEVLKRYRVGGWIDNGVMGDEPVAQACENLLAERSIPYYHAHAGDRLQLGNGIVLEVLHPPSPENAAYLSNNNRSLVMRLVWEEIEFLFPGDLEAEGELQLLESGQLLFADVLKIAHHGSGDSSTAEFLAAVNPRYAVISVGAGNRFGHPHAGVLNRLADLDEVTVLRTDQMGTVEFIAEPSRLWVRTEQ